MRVTVHNALPTAHEAREFRLSRTVKYIINAWVCGILIALFILAVNSGKL